MTASLFVSTPLLQPGRRSEGRIWTLAGELVAAAPEGRVTVPDGFATDGASVPRPLWWLISPHGRWFWPAVLHDYLYRLRAEGRPHPLAPSRRDADALFHAALRGEGTNPLTAWAMWAAVRLFGGA